MAPNKTWKQHAIDVSWCEYPDTPPSACLAYDYFYLPQDMSETDFTVLLNMPRDKNLNGVSALHSKEEAYMFFLFLAEAKVPKQAKP